MQHNLAAHEARGHSTEELRHAEQRAIDAPGEWDAHLGHRGAVMREALLFGELPKRPTSEDSFFDAPTTSPRGRAGSREG